MLPAIQLTTRRLLLRPTVQDDFIEWFKMVSDPEAMRFLGGPQNEFLAWLHFSAMAGAWYLEGISRFSVIEKATARWVGWAGPLRPRGWPAAEVGCGIVRDKWGCGYATEAVEVTLEWVFSHLGWQEVFHYASPENLMSQAVARKIGSEFRGTAMLPGLANEEASIVQVWSQTAQQWHARHAGRGQ